MSMQNSHTAACTCIKPWRQIPTQDRFYLQNEKCKKKKGVKIKKK